MKKLILIRGISGSGKSTFAHLLDDTIPDAVSISTDEYFEYGDEYLFAPEKLPEAHKWCQKSVKDMMFNNINIIIVHNTFTREWEMEPYIKMAEDMNYQVTRLIVENHHGSDSVHNVPEEALEAQYKRFEVELIPKHKIT